MTTGESHHHNLMRNLEWHGQRFHGTEEVQEKARLKGIKASVKYGQTSAAGAGKGKGKGPRKDKLEAWCNEVGITKADVNALQAMKFEAGMRAQHAAEWLTREKKLKPELSRGKFYKIAKLLLVTADGYSEGGEWAVTKVKGAASPTRSTDGNSNIVSDDTPAPWFRGAKGKGKAKAKAKPVRS